MCCSQQSFLLLIAMVLIYTPCTVCARRRRQARAVTSNQFSSRDMSATTLFVHNNICLALPALAHQIMSNIHTYHTARSRRRAWDKRVVLNYSLSSFYSPAQLGRFYPQRPSGHQCVVAGVFPSPPWYLPSFLSRRGFSIPTSQFIMLY